jgi:sugar phosphate isomerase/epimerase
MSAANGTPRLAVIDSTTPGLSLAEQLDVYSRAGATGIGLTEGRLGADVAAHVEPLRASGLTVTGCFLTCSSILPPGPGTAGPGSPELATPRARIDAMAAGMRRLAPLRPTFFYALAGPLGEHDRADARAIVVEGLRELADVAAAGGSGVALELFHTSLSEWSYLSEIPEAIAILDEVDRPNLQLAVDIWHLASGADVLDQLRAHAPRVASLHLDDRREPTRSVYDRVLPGDGTADVPGILGAADDGGFSGWYELEILSDDGRNGDAFPDSLWALDPFELVRDGREKFLAQWRAKR